jgi:hypothetical protein
MKCTSRLRRSSFATKTGALSLAGGLERSSELGPAPACAVRPMSNKEQKVDHNAVEGAL